MERRAREEIDLLIHGGTVVPMDEAFTVIPEGAVAVNGRDVVAVGPAGELGERYEPRERIDAAGHVVLPGLVNAHSHSAMTLFRGLADDLSLEAWLTGHIWPAEASFVDPDTVARGTALACVEMLEGGVTSCLDMYWYPEACGEAAREVGLRHVMGGVMVDFPGADRLTPEGRIAENRSLLERYREDPLLGVTVQPHSTYAVSPDLLAACRDLADEYGVRLALHASETAAENADVAKRYGRRPVGHLESLGMLGPRTTLLHGVHLDDGEIALLAERGVSVVHCLESELKLASGVPRLPELLAAGVNVGLGTDGAASNNDLDLWSELRLAALLFKARGSDPTLVPAREALRLATRGSACAAGIDHLVGSLEPGKRADVVLVDFRKPHLRPVYDVYSHLAYSVGRADVATVLVNGRVVVRDGRVTTVARDDVMARVDEVAGRIAAADRRRSPVPGSPA